MRSCPLCNLEIDESDLVRYYLSDKKLIGFIEKKHPGWTPHSGACSRCLEELFREYSSSSIAVREEITEEKTLITEASELIQKPETLGTAATLITIHGVDLGKKYDLVHVETLIGRGETCQIRINEENVSRLHSIIFKRGSEVIIEDQNSTNGTFVNTRKIKAKPLQDGDLILIGSTIMKFMSGGNIEQHFHEEIYKLATRDGLTQVYNKSFFLDRLTDEFNRSKRYDRDLSLLLFDFDHFKAVNDTFGHLAGDEILRKSATLIHQNLRKEDVCGRYGGEEFGVFLPETANKNALQIAEKLRKLIEMTRYQHGGHSVEVTISIGMASLGKTIKTVEQFIEAADGALYKAKKSGRNCVRSS
jgi:two-component system, cell cycle response regulator